LVTSADHTETVVVVQVLWYSCQTVQSKYRTMIFISKTFIVPDITYCVSSGTLNPTHSITPFMPMLRQLGSGVSGKALISRDKCSLEDYRCRLRLQR